MHNLIASGLPIRDDLMAAHAFAWDSMSKAGTWLTAERRVAVAAEARQAWVCAFCQLQKEALTPNSVTGTHTSLGLLADVEVELVHRIVSDPGRLSEAWYGSIIEQGIKPEEYIEIAGLVAITVMADTFAFGIGAEESPLPSPQGERRVTTIHRVPKRKPPGCQLLNRKMRLSLTERSIQATR